MCPIQVEADVSDGLPSFTMVGFPSAQVKEAQDRVRTALRNNGISLPPKRVTVNFAPADIKKEGAGFDMPVAAAVMAAAGMINPRLLKDVMMVGEISLNGEIHAVSGVLPRVIRAREMGCRFCIIPHGNLREAKLVRDMKVIGIRTLKEMTACLREPERFLEKETENADALAEQQEEEPVDFMDIRGQEGARRAAEIAVSGFHNILFIGPPGAGKTMLARRIPTIMPELTFEESLELTKIYSIAGLLSRENPLITKRPFRSPHHTSSPQALAGGGRIPRPGEITLAHRGVLFLDEMPEFSRRSLEILRQPLEDKKLQLSRISGTYVFPANFMLVAAMNPCPCGYYPGTKCRCTDYEVLKYRGKISGPIMDRIDIQKEVHPVNFFEITGETTGYSSELLRKKVEIARKIQQERYSDQAGVNCNAQMTTALIQKYCELDQESLKLLRKTSEEYGYSARVIHKLLRLARTSADIDKEEKIRLQDIRKVLDCRDLDKSNSKMLVVK